MCKNNREQNNETAENQNCVTFTLTLKLPLTLKYCLMHFYQSIHTAWARSSSRSKDILRGAI